MLLLILNYRKIVCWGCRENMCNFKLLTTGFFLYISIKTLQTQSLNWLGSWDVATTRDYCTVLLFGMVVVVDRRCFRVLSFFFITCVGLFVVRMMWTRLVVDTSDSSKPFCGRLFLLEPRILCRRVDDFRFLRAFNFGWFGLMGWVDALGLLICELMRSWSFLMYPWKRPFTYVLCIVSLSVRFLNTNLLLISFFVNQSSTLILSVLVEFTKSSMAHKSSLATLKISKSSFDKSSSTLCSESFLSCSL